MSYPGGFCNDFWYSLYYYSYTNTLASTEQTVLLLLPSAPLANAEDDITTASADKRPYTPQRLSVL